MRNRLIERALQRLDGITVDPRDEQAVRAVLDSLPILEGGERLDAGETAFFTRSLEFIKAKTYDIRYAALRFRDFIPVSHEVPNGADSITWRQYDELAVAQFVANYGGDIPKAEIYGGESSPVKVRSIVSGYGYNVQELRSAMFSGLDLDKRKASAVRKAVEQLMDVTSAIGNSTYSLSGFAKYSGVALTTLPNGTWSSATNAQVLEDLLYFVNKLSTDSKMEHKATNLLVGTTQWLRLTSKHFSTDNSRSVLQAFKEAHPEIQVDCWPRLDTANASNNGNRMVVYEKSPENMVVEIPQEFEQFDPQRKGLDLIIPCHARYGGVFVYYPLSMAYADGT